ncbi:MAG TPA: glycoside hydrolase family 3 C-terminal domain-containing protein [Terriglobia bacterium]|nr:glycoside hydrolase family 3 C-terminal domain-containing protein [Terriglobia bacterium]
MRSTRRWFIGGALAASATLAFLLVSAAFAESKAIYENPKEPIEKRVEDLLGRLTLEEKISQLMNDSPAINRLDVPAYNWWNEALHGVGRAGRATVFPQAIGLAATWDTDLMNRVATVISDEARAKYHEFVRRGKRNIYQGLTFWSPNINLFRDPRWGRGMETYGEDPFLTGRLAVSFIKGMQGDDEKYLKTVATVKHFAVHSGPEPARHTFDAVVSERDLRESYLPHFEAAIKEGGAQSVMCAYNSVDGDPACANDRLFEVLRKEWGFNGYVVSDCGAVNDISANHKKKPNAQEGAAAALKAGTDLNCGIEYRNLEQAVRAGLIAEADIDRALRRLLTARFKLGMFDPPDKVKYAQIPFIENDSAAHQALSVEAARKSIVLLKNEGDLLPLRKDLKNVAVIGPYAADVRVMLGNYNGIPSAPISAASGISRKLGRTVPVVSAAGSDIAENMPTFEVIPSVVLQTSDGPNARQGLFGQYFNTASFDGELHRPKELTYPNSGVLIGRMIDNPMPLFTNIDPRVSFMEWAEGAPRPDMNDDDFGVRWSGMLRAPSTGTYQLGAIGMNAWELYLGGRRIAQSNSIHDFAYRSAPVELEGGKLYPIVLDYHEYLNDAGIELVWSRPGLKMEDGAMMAAQNADVIIMTLGLSPRLEGEEMKVPVEGFKGGDRETLGLPRVQEELLKKVVALGKPVVLVLFNGSPLAINWAQEHVPAIIEAWYPGQAGGAAIADVLFGDYNPAGRLPVTVYKSADQLPPFDDYRMAGRTYRFFKDEPLYPFGYGLSYTTFAYRNLKVPSEVKIGAEAKISVEVENTGMMAGEEVAQLYIKGAGGSLDPVHSLAAFERIALKPGERKTVQLTVRPEQMVRFGKDNKRAIEAGSLEFSVGGGQPGKSKGTNLEGTIRLTGASKMLD